MRFVDLRSGAGLAAFAAMALAACAPQAPQPPEPADIGIDMIGPQAGPAPEVEPVAVGCPDDGPRFPASGLCVGRSIAYLDPDLDLIADAPEGCEWTMQETAFPDVGSGAQEVVLYRALSCNSVTTKLDFSGGAQSASMNYETSALGHSSEEEAVRIFGDGVSDPVSRIEYIASAYRADGEDCEVQPAGPQFPAGALVIGPSPEARAKLPQDEPVTACGEFGIDEDAMAFWLLRGGYAWHFHLGQDIPEIDPASFTLLRRDAEGNWSVGDGPAEATQSND